MKTAKFISVILCMLLLTGCAQENNTTTEIIDTTTVETEAIISDDTANPLIFIENETPCDPDTELQMDFEYASTLLHDALEADGKFLEGAIILDDGAYEINGTIYHCLAVCSDNGENVSRMGNFCVSDTDRTAVYISFDPTIDTLGMFADYAGEIDEDDYRTRLIKITGITQTTALPAIPSDEELIEMFNSAEKLRIAYFYNDDKGNFRTDDGRTIDQYREEFLQLFTDSFADEFFDIYGIDYNYYPSVGILNNVLLFSCNEDDVNYLIETHGMSFDEFKKLDFNNIDAYLDYDAIFIGEGNRGDNISIVGHELRITEKSADKITLTMTVWHCDPPDYEKKINEDYIYRLENGKLVIEGLFGGWTEDRKVIILDSEFKGTIAEDITETSEPNYLVNYEYNMVIEDGLWKFDSYPEWY